MTRLKKRRKPAAKARTKAAAPITPVAVRPAIVVQPERPAPEHSAWLADLSYAQTCYRAGDYTDCATTLRELERGVLGYTPPPGHRTKAREKVLRQIAHMIRTVEPRA